VKEFGFMNNPVVLQQLSNIMDRKWNQNRRIQGVQNGTSQDVLFRQSLPYGQKMYRNILQRSSYGFTEMAPDHLERNYQQRQKNQKKIGITSKSLMMRRLLFKKSIRM
jgi:hypothetical protein